MSEIVGTVVNVYDEWIGSTLAEDAASGTNELVVENGEWFGESGSLRIGDEEFTYTAEGDTLTLGDTLDNSYEEGEFVYVLPLASMRWAQVRETGSSETLLMRVPHALRALLDEGVRPEGEGEEIEGVLGVDGVAVITDVLGREPRIEGEFLRDHTVRREATTDGEPPSESPTPTVTGAIGALAVRWDAVSNHDPVTYEVHVSDSQGFIPSSSTLAAEVQGTLIFIRTRPGGGPLQGGTTYYVRLIARDYDGAAAPSDEASGEIVALNTGNIPSDGKVPPQVGTPSVTPGPGFLFVEWEPVENADPVAYEVHVSSDPGFTPGPSTLYARTPATSIVINKEPDGSNLDLETLYVVSIIATDPDGAGPGSDKSTGVAPAAQITETLITDNAISTPKLQANAVIADKIAANAVTAAKIAADAVTADKIAANAVTADKILADAVTAAKIAANAVTADKLLANEALFELLQTVLLISNTIKVPGETGQRLEVDADGLRLYSPTDEALVSFDAASGSARLRGVVDFGSDSHLLPSDVIELAEQGEGTFETPTLVQRFGVSGIGNAIGTRQMDYVGTSGVVRLMAVYTAANTTHTLSDSSGEPASGWELVQSVNTADGGRLSLWVRTSALRPGRNLPNVGFGANTEWIQVAFEYSGLALEDEDVAASASGSGTSISVGPTASTSQTDALVLGVIVSGRLAAEPSDYESLDAKGTVARVLRPYAKRVTSQGAQSIAATQATSGPWLGIVAAFKARASGNPPTPDADKVRVFARNKRLATINEDGLVSELVPRHAARVFRSSAQNIPTGTNTETAVVFTNISRDDGGFWNPANPTRLTAPEDGWYQVEGGFSIAHDVTGWRLAQLKRNGTVILDSMRVLGGGAINPVLSVSTLGYFEAGQFVELFVTQNSGSTLALQVTGTGVPLPYLAIARVA